ncbi:hypothetical protein HMPREF0208_01805 [Citrobacter koseri]|nr:hypothetical protein HMPREF3220_03732 [Citrobacter koseri]KXA00913.1 hypothetical protein HMPREF3207_03102 [Citrobacter koseri]KXB44458.1 hypothetical protein HMPREF0208_01805 [Citrobacter koseri]
MAIGMIFRQADDIVEITRGQYNKPVNILIRRQLLCRSPDATKMKNVMSAILLVVIFAQPRFELRLPVV